MSLIHKLVCKIISNPGLAALENKVLDKYESMVAPKAEKEEVKPTEEEVKPTETV